MKFSCLWIIVGILFVDVSRLPFAESTASESTDASLLSNTTATAQNRSSINTTTVSTETREQHNLTNATTQNSAAGSSVGKTTISTEAVTSNNSTTLSTSNTTISGTNTTATTNSTDDSVSIVSESVSVTTKPTESESPFSTNVTDAISFSDPVNQLTNLTENSVTVTVVKVDHSQADADRRLRVAFGVVIPLTMLIMLGGIAVYFHRRRQQSGHVLLLDEDELSVSWMKQQ